MVSVFHGGRTARLIVGRVERRCLTDCAQAAACGSRRQDKPLPYHAAAAGRQLQAPVRLYAFVPQEHPSIYPTAGSRPARYWVTCLPSVSKMMPKTESCASRGTKMR